MLSTLGCGSAVETSSEDPAPVTDTQAAHERGKPAGAGVSATAVGGSVRPCPAASIAPCASEVGAFQGATCTHGCGTLDGTNYPAGEFACVIP
jgi:hypothetical protein